MTLELLHGIRDYTLTRTSIPNHAGNIKYMKYTLIRSIINTESLTKSLQIQNQIGSSITNNLMVV